MAEQLLEVPTVLTLAVLAELIVDIPVPGREGGGQGGLQGFPPPRQSSTASVAEQIVDFPVGGLQGFLPRQGSRTANNIADIPAGAGLHGFLLDPGVSRSSAVSREEAGCGLFLTFPC